MVDAILIIGWRSDSGAYLVDSFPKGVDIDERDLMNLFSLHRMIANNNMDRAIPNFNFLKIQGFTVASWYSGFRTTQYLGKPDYCVAMMLSSGSPSVWELKLKTICYNILTRLEYDDFDTYIQEVLSKINRNEEIEPLEGFEKIVDNSSILSEKKPVNKPLNNTKPNIPIQQNNESSKLGDDFSDLIALAETQAGESGMSSAFGANQEKEKDPFSSTSDPFGATPKTATNIPTNDSNKNPFAGDPFAKPTQSASSNTRPPITANFVNSTKGVGKDIIESKIIIDELAQIDKKMPTAPDPNNKEQLFSFFEKKITLLEQKVGTLSKLIRGLQVKEIEVNEKNELITKLLALLS